MNIAYRPIGIACESGGFRCVFVHGALDTLESAGVRARVYAAASASVLPAAFAAIGSARSPGLDYWRDALSVRMREGNGMSEMVLEGLAKYGPSIVEKLFDDAAPRLIVAASEVVDPEAAEATQGIRASRLGREQLLAMARGDDDWAHAALRPVMLDTEAEGIDRLDRARFAEATYASSRMLHAWRVPATIDGRPFIDASYTVGFPALELAAAGVERIVAIATDAGRPWRNLYHREALPAVVDSIPIDLIAPAVDLKELGVDFTGASAEGLERAYDHGRERARAWLLATGLASSSARC